MTRILQVLLVASALGACSSSQPVLDTGIPNDTQVDELTDAEARQICERAEALANDVFGVDTQHELACTVTGVAYDVANLGTCRDSYADCIAEPFEGVVADFDCASVTAPMLDDCNATIGDIEACANAQLSIVDDLLDEVSCDLVDDPSRIQTLLAELEGEVTPPACEALPEACPTFFGEMNAPEP